MKKKLYVILAVVTSVVLMTGCSFFQIFDNTSKDDTSVPPTKEDTTDVNTTEDNNSVSNTEDNNDESTSTKGEVSDPREDVANDSTKKYTGTGKYCGFIDSTCVEVELADGSCCTFFVFDEDVRSTLSALNEEDMPEISFSYKAKEGQINPEIVAILGD